MADRKDFFFRQIVAENDVDAAFADLEVGDLRSDIDHGLAADDVFAAPFPDAINGGIASGLVPSLGTYPNVAITTGVAYDSSGRRIKTNQTFNVNVTRDGQTAVGSGGTPDGLDTDPGAGKERWISLSILFDRLLSDPRVDGNNVTVYFQRAESFRFKIRTGAAKAAGTLVDADRPAMATGEIWLCDLIRSPTAFVGAISQTRRQDWMLRTSGASPAALRTLPLTRLGEPRGAASWLLGLLDDHVTNTVQTPGPNGRNTPAFQHNASALLYGGSGNFADAATSIAAGSLEASLDSVVSLLAAAVDPAGAKLIGAKLQSGVAGTSGIASLAAGTLEAQLTSLLTGVNSRLLRSGDVVAGDLLPDSTASNRNLGITGQRWDGFFETLDALLVSSDLIPTATGKDLGSSGARWDAHLQVLTLYSQLIVSGSVVNGSWISLLDTMHLGASATRWGTAFVKNLDFSTDVLPGAGAAWSGSLLPRAASGTLLGSTAGSGNRWTAALDYLDLDSSGTGDRILIKLLSGARAFLKTRADADATTTTRDSPLWTLLGSGWDGAAAKELGFAWQTDVQTGATAWRLRLAKSVDGALTQLVDLDQDGNLLPAVNAVGDLGKTGLQWNQVRASLGQFQRLVDAGAALDVDGPTGVIWSTSTLADVFGEVQKDAGNTRALLKATQSGTNATAPAIYGKGTAAAPGVRAEGGAAGVPALALGAVDDGLFFDDATDTLTLVSDGADAPTTSVVKAGAFAPTKQLGSTGSHAKRLSMAHGVWGWGDVKTNATTVAPGVNGVNILGFSKNEASNYVEVTFVDLFEGGTAADKLAVYASLAAQGTGGLSVDVIRILDANSDITAVRFQVVNDANTIQDINNRRINWICAGMPK